MNIFSAVDCGPLSVPMNGSSSGDSTVFPNSVLFKCDPGFILSGSTIRVCQPNGTWNGSPTVCSGRSGTKQNLFSPTKTCLFCFGGAGESRSAPNLKPRKAICYFFSKRIGKV